MEKFDFVIMGAGIVGLSVALRLSEIYSNSHIAIIDKEPEIGRHASGRNSGVMHSGIYYGADTLKARMCTTGAARMIDFVKEHHIAFQQKGKVIVATTETEGETLKNLLDNAVNNKIEAYLHTEQEITQYEPYAKAPFGGIYCPGTAVVDSHAILKQIQAILLTRKVAFYFNSPLCSVNVTEKSIQVGEKQHSIHYGYFFNCTGTSSVRIAKMFAIAKEFELLPFKGLYYKVKPEKNYLVHSNIYPVPNPLLPFLGVHLTRVVTNDIYVGPTVIPALGHENYSLFNNINIKELGTILKFLTTMVLQNKQHFRFLVVNEMKKYIKPYFVNAACKLINGLQAKDLLLAKKVGIRPQLVNIKNKMLENDFILQNASHSTHVLNAISPAFTSALAFADCIVEKANI